MPLDDENVEPDAGISVIGFSDREIVEIASDALADLIGQDGVSDPWLVTDEQLAAIEATLPKEKHA